MSEVTNELILSLVLEIVNNQVSDIDYVCDYINRIKQELNKPIPVQKNYEDIEASTK